MIFILPETKGISLERMDKLFGEVDAVAAGEEETSADKIEAMTYSGNAVQIEHAHNDSKVEQVHHETDKKV